MKLSYFRLIYRWYWVIRIIGAIAGLDVTDSDTQSGYGGNYIQYGMAWMASGKGRREEREHNSRL
jgi:hypothetical protein